MKDKSSYPRRCEAQMASKGLGSFFESLCPWLGGQWSGKTSITRNAVLRTDLVKLGLEQLTQLLLSLRAQQSLATELPSPRSGWEAEAMFLTTPRPPPPRRIFSGMEALRVCPCASAFSTRLPSPPLGSRISLFYFKVQEPEKQLKLDFRHPASSVPNVRCPPSHKDKKEPN